MPDKLEGKPLRYLIGSTKPVEGKDGEIFEIAFKATKPPKYGIGIKYCNLFDEDYDEEKPPPGKYGPYLDQDDTAKEYGEGKIDPNGAGWNKNLNDQFKRAKNEKFIYIELDNPDAYSWNHVLGAINLAKKDYGLKVIAKNPHLMEKSDAAEYLGHENIFGVIIEEGDKDTPTPSAKMMDELRARIGKPALPVWFVFYIDKKKKKSAAKVATTRAAAQNASKQIIDGKYKNMGVTLSDDNEEYAAWTDILQPIAVA